VAVQNDREGIMSRSKIGASLAILVSVTNSSAMADYRITMTGDDLLTLCRGMDIQTKLPHPSADGECLHYIMGTMDLWGALRTNGAVKDGPFDVDFCLPPNGIKGGLAISVVINYLENTDVAQRAGNEGPAFILPALSRAFPCS
jgi:hypothetical protein